MHRRARLTAVAAFLALAGLAGTVQPAAAQEAPALVVVIVVDQLRGDYIDRFQPNLTGALLRFRDQGAFFPLAEQDHANTSTAPGHSTILSGRVPAHTGILSNDLGVPDPGSPLIAGAEDTGASPHRFRGTTLYDWMLAADPETRALSVGRKDRGAILPIGAARTHVYWWADARFTTSTYYRTELPDWATAWNARFDAGSWPGREWTLLLPESAYPEPDDMPYEGVGARRTNTFPHRLTTVDSMWAFPWADSLTLDFAMDGVRALQLGQRDGTDLLAIALSTLDVVGHHYGPDSREVHDMTLRVDRWLGAFMEELETIVPRERVLYVLTSDHGVQSMPEHLHLHDHEDAGRVALAPAARRVMRPIQDRFQHSFGFTVQNGVVLADTAALRARGLDVAALSAQVAREIGAVPGVDAVWTPATLAAAPADDASARLFRRAIPSSYGWLAAAHIRDNWVMTTSIQATHGSLVKADRSVPIAFLGRGIRPVRVERMVATVDIAPTLARLLGIQPAEALDGREITEVVTSVQAATSQH
jgi:predicted AlkP superfamily pyrophosphatase or phosphodiesterase